MNRCKYSWAALTLVAAVLGGCETTTAQWGDIGMGNDMADRQQRMREHRAIPDATQMPPGLGEDLPIPATQPLTSNQ